MLEDLASEFNLRVQVSLIGSLLFTLPSVSATTNPRSHGKVTAGDIAEC